MRNTLIAIGLLGLAACGQTTTPATTTEAPATTAAAPTTREEATARDTCGASQYSSMIGTNIAAVTLPANDPNVRVIMPDTVVTQDFRADRANIIAGADGVITAVECY